MDASSLVRGTDGCGKLEACVEALEPYHIDLVSRAVESGWSEKDVAAGLMWRALLHVALLNGTASDLDDVADTLQSLLS